MMPVIKFSSSSCCKFNLFCSFVPKRCTGCHGDVSKDSPVVYAERAGYHDALWHPTCFVCSECGHGLADLVYFWSNQKLLCGRHYCESVWPRCCGCDEVMRLLWMRDEPFFTLSCCLWINPASPSSAHLLQVVHHGGRRTDVASATLLLLEVRPEPGFALSALTKHHKQMWLLLLQITSNKALSVGRQF